MSGGWLACRVGGWVVGWWGAAARRWGHAGVAWGRRLGANLLQKAGPFVRRVVAHVPELVDEPLALVE